MTTMVVTFDDGTVCTVEGDDVTFNTAHACEEFVPDVTGLDASTAERLLGGVHRRLTNEATYTLKVKNGAESWTKVGA